MTHTDFADTFVRQLQADGYAVHQGAPDDGPDLAGSFWFSWSVPGMAEAEVGGTVDTELAAWSAALQHRLANSAIGLHTAAGGARRSMGHFYPAALPAAAFDPAKMASRFGLPLAAAQAQVDAMRRQTVFMNDVYQVNVGLVEAPFGSACGDMAWLSIKRRDRATVHDWRDLQEIKPDRRRRTRGLRDVSRRRPAGRHSEPVPSLGLPRPEGPPPRGIQNAASREQTGGCGGWRYAAQFRSERRIANVRRL